MPQVEMIFQDDPYLGAQRGTKEAFYLASYLSQGCRRRISSRRFIIVLPVALHTKDDAAGVATAIRLLFRGGCFNCGTTTAATNIDTETT
jgi:hypothetical protein